VGYLAAAVVIRIVDGVLSPNLYQGGEPMMTDEMIILRALLEKKFGHRSAARDGPISRAAPDGVAGREPDRRSTPRAQPPAAQPSQRCSDRDWDASGTAERSIPKLRKAGCFPSFPRRTAEKALTG
jgi:hypothetical protein